MWNEQWMIRGGADSFWVTVNATGLVWAIFLRRCFVPVKPDYVLHLCLDVGSSSCRRSLWVRRHRRVRDWTDIITRSTSVWGGLRDSWTFQTGQRQRSTSARRTVKSQDQISGQRYSRRLRRLHQEPSSQWPGLYTRCRFDIEQNYWLSVIFLAIAESVIEAWLMVLQ